MFWAHRFLHRPHLWPGLASLLLAVQLAVAPPVNAESGDRLRGSLHGKIVQAGLSGFEPDFDRIDRVIIAATLHDAATAPTRLPDSMLVLSTYLENFQPDTTPVLPDLLHPNQTASGLGGFMSGKAALVNAAGRMSYRGGVLAEVFLDNSVHIVVDLQRSNAPATAPTLRIKGIFTLAKNLSVEGQLQSARPLTGPEQALLRVSPGRLPRWQTVVGSMAVKLPKMMGTGGAGAPATVTPTTVPRPATVPLILVVAGGIAGVLALAAALALWWRRGVRKAAHPSAP